MLTGNGKALITRVEKKKRKKKGSLSTLGLPFSEFPEGREEDEGEEGKTHTGERNGFKGKNDDCFRSAGKEGRRT